MLEVDYFEFGFEFNVRDQPGFVPVEADIFVIKRILLKLGDEFKWELVVIVVIECELAFEGD